MEFPKSYFEDEVRDGFYVSSLMKRAWAAQLEVLDDVDKVCKKYNIEYFAEWGTLLGAIRHGGFVPWDDDLDICMKREDYDKFSRVAPEELKEFYRVFNFEHCNDDECCDNYLTRVFAGNRIRTDQKFMEKFHGFPYIAGIDIFPLDYMAPTEKEDRLMVKELSVISSLAMTIDEMSQEEIEGYLQDVENIYHVRFDHHRPLAMQLHQLADKLGARCKEKDATYITAMALHTITGYKIPKEHYAEAVWLPFENTRIPIPVGYDAILKTKYGDYMRPVRDGGSHDYPFYDRQRVLYEASREPLFKTYQFNPADIADGEERMQEGKTLKEIVTNMVALLAKAHQEMVDLMEDGDFEPVLTILEDCQEGAIALGTKIEEVKGEGLAIIAVLEKYCEVLYTIHEAILGNAEMDVQTAIDLLDDNLTAINAGMDKEIIHKKQRSFYRIKLQCGILWKVYGKQLRKIRNAMLMLFRFPIMTGV